MHRLLRLAPLVAACFAVGVGLPRTTFWRHHHEGGEHAHVHAHGPSSHDHDEHHAHPHHDDHHHHHDDDHAHDAPAEPPSGPGLHVGGGADHAHTQAPFLRVDRSHAVAVSRFDRVLSLPAIHAGEPAAPARPSQRSRGPPAVRVSTDS